MSSRIIRRGDRPSPAARPRLRAAEPPRDAETSADGRTSRAVTALAVLSLVLGTVQTGSPGATARLVGADDGPTSRAMTRWACGVRELVVGAGIAAGRSPRPWLWARVAGDALDLALLGVAVARHPARRDRALAATAAVAGITVTDIGTARRVSAYVDPPPPQ
jgi:hypothetical protein